MLKGEERLFGLMLIGFTLAFLGAMFNHPLLTPILGICLSLLMVLFKCSWREVGIIMIFSVIGITLGVIIF